MKFDVKYAFKTFGKIVVEAKDEEDAKKQVMVALYNDAIPEPMQSLYDYGVTHIEAKKCTTDEEAHDFSNDSALDGKTVEEFFEENKEDICLYLED